jgi:hypothetical protein
MEVEMKEKVYNIVLVLDETGSMIPHKDVTLSSINEYIDSLKADENNYNLNLVTFNSGTGTKVVFEHRDINSVYYVKDSQYTPDHMTPLYDSIGWSLNRYSDLENVIFVIMTDGQENYSKEYTHETIFKLIEDKTEEGWQFVFMGANQDAYVTGSQLGLQQGQTLSFDAQNPQRAYNALYSGTISYTAQEGKPSSTFFEDVDIREDSQSTSKSKTTG